MKIKFVYPKFDKFLDTYPELAEMPPVASIWTFTMPPALGIPILAGLTPEGIDWHVQDQNVEEILFEDDSDLIAISYFTPQAAYAYELGDEFMKHGKTVIMGGMHPSMIPGDALNHCHSVCIGEADAIWQEIIRDFQLGRLRRIYKACRPPRPDEIAVPRFDIFDVTKYGWDASLISVSRGCPYGCSWCNIPVYQGNEIRLKPLDAVDKEIRMLSGREFYITDDVVTWNREHIQRYMLDLCDRIRDYGVGMFLSGSPAMNRDPRFLRTLAHAGCKNMYVVFASDAFSRMFYACNTSIWDKCIDLVRAVEDAGIRFFASFGLGFDYAGEEQFDLIMDFCQKAKIKTAEFFIATPFPHTPLWQQFRETGRLIEPVDWKKFNCAHVVFRPLRLSEERLLEGFLSVWKTFYKGASIDEFLQTFPTLRQKAVQRPERSSELTYSVCRNNFI